MTTDFNFSVSFINAEKGIDAYDDNVDVEVVFRGVRYLATFFTPANIGSILARYEKTGECRSGVYMWASNMIIVRSLTVHTVFDAVQGMIEDGDFEKAFMRTAE